MELKFKNINLVADIQISEIAESFAVMDSDQQAVVLREFFDALKYHCEDHSSFESQLCWIANSIDNLGVKNELKYVFECLDYFLKDEKEKEDF